MAKPGRPVKVSQIRFLSRLQCSEKEAAAQLEISLERFREIIEHDEAAKNAWEFGREAGRASLRRAQFRLAERSASMAIFLGKVYLGQREVQVLEHTGPDGGPVQTLDLGKLSDEQLVGLEHLLLAARVEKKE